MNSPVHVLSLSLSPSSGSPPAFNWRWSDQFRQEIWLQWLVVARAGVRSSPVAPRTFWESWWRWPLWWYKAYISWAAWATGLVFLRSLQERKIRSHWRILYLALPWMSQRSLPYWTITKHDFRNYIWTHSSQMIHPFVQLICKFQNSAKVSPSVP